MRAILFFAAFAASAAANGANGADWKLDCPAETARPISISVFDGPPSEMADLVPDNPSAKVQRWTFDKKRTRDIYIVCNYADTRLKLARKAPAEVTVCSLRPPNDPVTGVVCR